MQASFAKVEWSKEITKRVWEARFVLNTPPAMEFFAGQYCSFKIKDNIRRTFSIATSPGIKSAFEVCADVTPMGPGSVWLMNLKQGDRVEFVGPLGKFIIDRQSIREPVYIATGTGIAPIRSMIYETLAKQKSEQVNQNIHLYWGLRFEEDIFWNEEFMKLEEVSPDFQYFLTLSQPKQGWIGRKGYVTQHLENLKDLTQNDFYLCGSRGTIDSIKELLVSRGVPSEQVKTELFF